MKQLSLVFLILLISSCAYHGRQPSPVASTHDAELLKFAKANCFFWYFKKNNYDLKDIRAISGGIVETGTSSANKFQQASFLVKEYNPQIATKHGTDIDLLKCFELENDEGFLKSLAEIE